MTPQEPKGEQASAGAGVEIAIRLLEHALVAYGSTSKEGKAINECLPKLAKAFSRSEDQALSIMPAELKTALMAPAGAPGPGGSTPAEAPPAAA
jgi:hypothetical protein